jgi:hypothetical protein
VTDDSVTPTNAEPSMNLTFRGITIDRSVEYPNAANSIRVKSEFDSNVIDEREKQQKKLRGPRISKFLGIKID